ncbi:hypothetical protein AAF712_008977 [Marasmius tenuissimus]|uniref:Uncharacterized protein n=1 Tax=Marasmius tenuissimus TaxID=585030 RepID=A0ABR2ZSN3_9AGAR
MSWLSYLGLSSDSTNKTPEDQPLPQSLPRPAPSDTQAPNPSGTMGRKSTASQSHPSQNRDKHRRQQASSSHTSSPPSQTQYSGSSGTVAYKTRSSQLQPDRNHDNSGKRRGRLGSMAHRLSGNWGAKETKQEERSSVPEHAINTQETNREEELLAKLEATEKKYRAAKDSHEAETSRVTSLQERLDSAQRERRQAEDQAKAKVGQLQNQLQRSNSQFTSLQRGYDELKSRSESAQREAERKKREYLSLQTHCESLGAQHEDLKRRGQTLESEHKRLKVQFDNKSGELQQLQEKHKAQQLILDQRTKELQEAQAYLTSTRSTSGADIIRLVESLNAEILQVASSITDELPFDQTTPAGTTGRRVVTAKYLGSLFGEETIATATYFPSEDDLDIIIQNALQHLMVSHCKDLIERWNVDPAVSKFLKEMYQRIRKNNSSSVAGRWRTMTKAEMKYGRYDQVENYARTHIVDDIRSLIRRWMERSDKRAQAGMLKMIETKVATVINMATQIDKAMGIDVVAEDWEAFVVHPGKAFNAALMEDVFQTSKSPITVEEATGIVLCPTAMGLRRRNSESDENGGYGGWQIMRKATVLLDTAFGK